MECYFCKRPVTKKELLIEEVPFKNKKVERSFHFYCAPKMLNNLDDQAVRNFEHYWFGKVYHTLVDWIGCDVLDRHTVSRIKGMRIGRYMPKGQNTLGLKGGYGFDVIYTATILASDGIKRALKTVDFKDEKHRGDYIMKIIEDKLPIAQKAVNRRTEEAKKLSNIIEDDPIYYEDIEYKKQEDPDKKIRDLLDELGI